MYLDLIVGLSGQHELKTYYMSIVVFKDQKSYILHYIKKGTQQQHLVFIVSMYVGGVSKASVAAANASLTPSPVLADVSQYPSACILFASLTPFLVETVCSCPSSATRSDFVPISII